MAYNGWMNWETWNVELWMNNDEGTYNAKMAQIESVDDPDDIDGAFVEQFVKSLFPDGTPDMMNRDRVEHYAAVNWDEIADGWREECDVGPQDYPDGYWHEGASLL